MSTYTLFVCFFFSPINTCTVFSHGWESADAEGQLYTILYKELEHPWILTSTEGPGTNTLQILRDDLSLRGVKSYTQIFGCAGIQHPNHHVVYIYIYNLL